MSSVPERDWKILRRIKDDLLRVACESIFLKVEQLLDERKDKAHECYLDLWTLIKNEDKTIAEMFDDLKRSNAIFKLASLKHYGVLSDSQLADFSKETQEQVKKLCEYKR